jgi:Rhodopirellula transposase DDE domain
MCCVAVPEDAEAVLAAKFAVMRRVLDERQWRVYLGTEADALGRGGIAAVARASGASQATVAAGAAEAEDEDALGALAPGQVRRPGAGRPKAEDAQPGLRQALGELLEEATRGDPVSGITWCSRSLRDLARQMAARGFTCGKDALARILRGEGYSLQAMAKVLEGTQHPDRDGQFGHINAMIAAFGASGHPVVSVDTKSKEQLGPYHRHGRTWRPRGDPVKVLSHDFPGEELGKITPYGVYDITANTGFVSVGASHDTAAFAVNALRLWWQSEGSLRYPGARRLLVTCDCGGSNGYRCRGWKDQLAVLAAETGLKISVCHFPPGTSKWNKIEHRLFCHITRTWRARPLMTADDAVAGIAATITSQGLKCTAVRDDAAYPGGVKVSDDRMRHLEDRVLIRHGPHRDWNYTVLPAPRAAPGPQPQPGPGPGRAGRCPQAMLNCPALTGMDPADLTALAAALQIPSGARREQAGYARRGGPRVKALANGDGTRSDRRIDLTDHVLAVRLRDHLHLAPGITGALLGVHPTTISHAISRTRQLLASTSMPLPPAPPPGIPLRTLDDLREYAAAAGITLTIPPAGPQAPKRTRRKRAEPATRPEQPT